LHAYPVREHKKGLFRLDKSGTPTDKFKRATIYPQLVVRK
jgi:Na+-translocating ferredoxin:NAD+ oxidoreductase RnfG subunit